MVTHGRNYALDAIEYAIKRITIPSYLRLNEAMEELRDLHKAE